MDSKDYKRVEFEDEIHLKDIILALIKHKRLIAFVTCMGVVISIVYTFFIATPKYEAISEVVINAPKTIVTRYGEFEFHTESTDDYAKYALSNEVIVRLRDQLDFQGSIEELKSRIAVKNDKDSNKYTYTTVGKTPSEAKAINDYLNQLTEKALRLAMKNQALEYFISYYEVKIASLTNDIEHKESVLNEIKSLLGTLEPIYTLQKSIFDDPETAAMYADRSDLDFAFLSEGIIVEEYVNENYFMVQEEATTVQLDLINNRQSLNYMNKLLKDLKNEKTEFDENVHTESEALVLNNKLDVFSDQFYVMSDALEPVNPVEPRKGLNLAIGLSIGLLLGCFVAFMKSYMQKI